MEWTVVLAGPARKSLKRIPTGDRTRILAVLGAMQRDPFQSDIRKLQGLSGFRCRVGNWRVFFRGRPRTQSRCRDRNRAPYIDHVLNCLGS